METTRSEEMAVIFRKLAPINQRYLLMMVYIAVAAEKNARKKYWALMEPEQESHMV